MKINNTEYNLPYHIEAHINSILSQIEAGNEPNIEWIKSFDHYEPRVTQPMFRAIQPLNAKRRSGQTTRIIDHLIQELFTNGEAVVFDHFDKLECRMRVADIMKRRLDMEHGGRYKFDPKTLKFTL